MKLPLPFALLLVAGCATARPALLPPPFSAAELRAASQPGRTYVFETTKEGGEPTRRSMVFVSLDDAGADMRAGEGREISRSTWAELESHGRFPEGATKVTAGGVIKVPAGAYETTLYVVKTAEGERRFWFAKTLPGPPIRYETVVGGEVVEKNVLVEHKPGGEGG